MALLEATGVTKVFGQLTALSEVDFGVEEGQLHGLIGPNGSGKSTLLKCIADRKSTRLNSSHGYISYAVFCLKKKKHYPVHFPDVALTVTSPTAILVPSPASQPC